MRQWLLFKIFLLCTVISLAQSNATFKGLIKSQNGQPVFNVQVIISPINKTVTTDSSGSFSTSVPANQLLTVTYNHLNFIPFGEDFTLKPGESKTISIKLIPAYNSTGPVIIKEKKKENATEISVDIKAAKNVVTASDDGIGFVKSLASVNSNNELSSSYSVRGGSFDENLIYVNGIQVYRPFLVRAGQQEGLSFVNGDMISDITFSAGGFDAKYGDKLSSVLDITYLSPDSLTGAFSASMLGARATVGNKHGKLSYIMSGRYKSNSYLLGSLETQADYRPLFFDYQTYIDFKASKKWSFGFLGNTSLNQFRMVPQTRVTRFGGISQAFQ